MNKAEVKKALDDAMISFNKEVEFNLNDSTFNENQKEELRTLMREVFYTFSEFQKVIEKIAK